MAVGSCVFVGSALLSGVGVRVRGADVGEAGAIVGNMRVGVAVGDATQAPSRALTHIATPILEARVVILLFSGPRRLLHLTMV